VTGVPSNYWGNGFSPRGDKGRFVLPTDFRPAVLAASNNSPILCLDIHHKFRCLVGFGLSRAAAFAAQIQHEERIALERGEPFDPDERASQLGGFERSKFDESGRFILPDYLGEAIDAGDALYFHGGGNQFTIWAPDVLFTMGAGWDNAKRKCRSLIDAGAGRGRRK
jgi:MraZ protein